MPTVARAQAPPPESFDYQVPVQATSPWPEMRRDRRNTGDSPIPARYTGDQPWAFTTDRGIFSTPIIGGDDTAYVGSADHTFYAINRDGSERWRFTTGGIIDAAGVIGEDDPALGTAPITIGSGDETLYQLRSDPGPLSPEQRSIWQFRSSLQPATGQLVNWWEGNVALGLDGRLYTGNTGGAMYSLTSGGALRWTYQTGNSVWTTPAFADDGSTYWGSLDRSVYKLDANGGKVWATPTLGFVTSSPALGRDGTVYVGSFDSKLYALDPATGSPKWSFTTDDHIYSSPALSEDATGATRRIYIASADGMVYALTPTGQLVWRYDTGDAVRSSPVVGRAPEGETGEIVYVGSSNGKLYALDADSGERRWSFDTTPPDPALRDRNDLNGSPALGRTGVYIGGEHGRLWYVPYDYCLAHREDGRCETSPSEEWPDDMERVFAVSSGGTTLRSGFADPVPEALTLPTRLVVRDRGETLDAAMQAVPDAESLVKTDPPFDFTAQVSGDGHYLFVVPDDFLRPDTQYRVRLSGTYLAEGVPVGNTAVGGTRSGDFDDTVSFRTPPPDREPLRLEVARDHVSALELRRLAVPLPPFLPSVNQIGFDSYDLIVGAIDVERTGPGSGDVLLWVIAGRRDAQGRLVADPHGTFAFPLRGRYRGRSLILSQRDLTLTLSFGKVPVRRFELRARLDGELRAMPGSSLYGEVTCSKVPNYGPALFITGLCNSGDTLPVSGTYLTEAYSGDANQRRAGVRVGSIALERPTPAGDGRATAALALDPGAQLPAEQHVASILLTDAASGEVVPLDYLENREIKTDGSGNIVGVTLKIPRGAELPEQVRVWVIADVFPLGAETFAR